MLGSGSSAAASSSEASIRTALNLIREDLGSNESSQHPYLDRLDGTVEYENVPWQELNFWLSELNGNVHVNNTLCKGVSREKTIEELDSRMGHKDRGPTDFVFGYGFDWRKYENRQGYTHLEELLIYQPKGWKTQAREYLYRFGWDLEQRSLASYMYGLRFIEKRYTSEDGEEDVVSFSMNTPALVVLFHPEMNRTSRYEALNFLLAYGVKNTLAGVFQNVDDGSYARVKQLILKEISPLDYFIEFQLRVQSYSLDMLREVGKQSAFPRLPLIKELDFSTSVMGQRLAKHVVRQQVVKYILKRKSEGGYGSNSQPLSLIFAGPSGNGKTELAMQLAELMNKPGDDAFLKIDCGKLTTSHEVFGMSGAYYGSKEGSALNNFVLRMSMRPDAVGIVLLDEIEKADEDVIYGLYQVIDKAEWTNKKLAEGRDGHTETVSCFNIIFIMTTNAADKVILDYAKSKKVYTADEMDLEEFRANLEHKVRSTLQTTRPFNGAFVARVDSLVPFLPMSQSVQYEDPLLGEMMAVAKMFIEREQEHPSAVGKLAEVDQLITTETKHHMAEIIVREAIPEAGV